MKKFKNLIILSSYLFILGIIFSLLIYKSISIKFLVFNALESITISSITCLISNTKKSIINKIIKILVLTTITIFYIAQYVHYNFYDCFFSVYSLINGGQVFGFINAILKEIKEHILGIILMLLLLTITIITIIKTKEDYYKKRTIIILAISIISLTITSLTLIISPNTNNIYSQKNLLTKTNSEVKNNKEFGLIIGMLIDTYRYNNNYNEEILEESKTKETIKEIQNTNYNITNINFDKIKSNNKKIQKLNTYFKNQNPTNKNEYTGIFKNKNLIFITAESLYFNAITKQETPTLYKMINNSLEFTNFYTPIYYASTSDGEYTNLTGILPKEGTWSFIASQSNTYPYTYSNVLKENKYKTYAYHNGEYNFYNRNTVMPNFGYNSYKGCGNGLESKINCNLWPQSDEEMFKETINDYKNDEHFLAYYMTISTHLSHDFKTNDIAKKHQKEVTNLHYSNNVKAYISALKELDQGLEQLLNNLEKNNLLNDTVIVITPDHYPYGLSNKELNEIKKLNTPYDKYKSGLIIYNPSLKHKKITKYASNIDILPTILNMFDIKYDSRIIIGKDIMSKNDGIVIFNDRSFLTNKGYYNEKKNKFTYFKKNTTNKYIYNKRKEVFNKTNASSLLLETNYYKYITKEAN